MSIRTRRKPMRAVAAAAAAAVGASLLAVSASSPVGAGASVTTETRIAGADRYATANAVAAAVDAADTTSGDESVIVLASGENFPDGLSAAALAGALNAPMLLTPAAALPNSVLTQLGSLTSGVAAGTKNIVLIGGTSAISADIATQLTALGFSVTRISGADRYETANEVAEAVYVNNGSTIGTFGGYKTAFLANGNNFPDALAASSWAYKNKHPLFLTNGSTLTDGTIASMQAVGVQQVIILGGEAAVSAEVATAVSTVTGVITSTRITGDTRYDTATALATTLATVDAGYKTNAMLVSGTNFPDALAAAQLAGQAGTTYAIIPVTDPLPAAVSTWATANQATLTKVKAIGGTAAIPDTVVAAVDDAGTIAPLTSTITGVDGGSTITVTFSANVTETSAETKANYTWLGANGATKDLTSATMTYTADTTAGTYTLVISGVSLVAGDTFTIVANKVVSAATAGLYVATNSLTVTASTDVPTVSITAIPVTVSATNASATDRVWLTFSSNASMSAANGAAALLEANLLYKGPGIGDVQVAAFTSCAQVASTTTWACDVDRSLADTVVGGQVYILAGKFFSTASTPVGNAATVVTVANDATAPTLSSATFTQTATGGSQASRGLALAAGNITVSAKAAGALDGKAGNSAYFAVVVGAQYAGAETCVYSSTTKTVTISAATTSSALAAALACSNSATASPVVTVAATDGALTGLSAGANALAGGADKVTVTLTFSEALSVAAASDLTFSNAVAASTAITAAAATNDGRLTGVITATYRTTGTTQTGLTTVTPSANIKDLAGNAMTATAKAMTAA